MSNAGGAGASNDGEDMMDSFIDQDMEDNMAWDTTAPGSGNKKRKGSRYAPASAARVTQPQDAFQPGATALGELLSLYKALCSCCHTGVTALHTANSVRLR